VRLRRLPKFIAARDSLFPQSVIQFFHDTGIPRDRDIELSTFGDGGHFVIRSEWNDARTTWHRMLRRRRDRPFPLDAHNLDQVGEENGQANRSSNVYAAVWWIVLIDARSQRTSFGNSPSRS